MVFDGSLHLVMANCEQISIRMLHYSSQVGFYVKYTMLCTLHAVGILHSSDPSGAYSVWNEPAHWRVGDW